MKPLTLQYAEQKMRAALDAGDLAQADLYGDLIDALEAVHQQPISLADAALWYASLGMPVFPLQPRRKIPYGGSHGFADATTEPIFIERWWRERPESNVGIATGHVVDVVDVDGEVGEVQMMRIIDEQPKFLSDSLGVVSTPRPGGRHFYIHASGRPNSASRRVGHIDVRGLGGYVVAPPSVLDEPYVGTYTWLRPLDVGAIGPP